MTAGLDEELLALGAVLVEQRVLRRAIKRHRRIRGVGLQVPHERCYVLARRELARTVDRRELAVELASLPDQVILVAGDRPALVAGDPDSQCLLWRALFHARIHQRFEQLLADEALGAAAIRERTERVGRTELEEIRAVLEQEDLLLPPVDPISIYVEFVALYLELVQFAPAAVERTFPALFDRDAIDAVIALDIDAAALLAETRPPRAPATPHVVPVEEPEPPEVSPPPPGASDHRAWRGAAAARRRGNRARAAILAARAGDIPAARADLEALTGDLAGVLGVASTDDWVDALLPVAQLASARRSLRFDAGARLLHDLQATCVIARTEHEIVDPLRWAISRGKQPIVRAIPATREVRIAKRLHAAEGKVAACVLASRDQRDRLAAVIKVMTRRGDVLLRGAMRPELESALDAVGLRPRSLPERVAQKKLVDELLDRLVAQGRLSIQDLRDAISRNDLKMPDLSLGQLRAGDPLLASDRILAGSLDGVYRRGESYMRWLQRVSSVLFGTPVGRTLTLYLFLPLLASFAIVEGLQQMVGPAWVALFEVEPVISTTESLLGGALFLFLLIHVRPFRRGLLWTARKIGWILKLLLVDLPLACFAHPWTQWLLATPLFRWLIKPAVPAGVVTLLVDGAPGWIAGGALFAATALALNSRLGRVAEEVAIDWLVRFSSKLTTRIIPALVKYTLELFADLLELVERFIYRVDNWLRFRKGQSAVTLVLKGLFGPIWGALAYVLRLYINLFVEPTINPIKHFPVVTVAAKLILPFIPALMSGIGDPVSQLMGPAVGNSFAAFTVLVLPGLAGFLVWELKENWRLYRATRAPALKPIAIGHHGESMATLLKPGFHAGTIPKLFTKLRRAAWRGDGRAMARHKEGLHHVEEAIATFARRQLVSMLNEAPAFRASPVALEGVEIASTRVRIAVACPGAGASPADATVIQFERQAKWLVASVPRLGWIERLDEAQRRIVEVALAGFYKLSGVDLVREQLETLLGEDGPTPPYEIVGGAAVLWPGPGLDTQVVYDLRRTRPKPRVRGPRPERQLPSLHGRHPVFGRVPIPWARWSMAWHDISDGNLPRPVAPGPSLLRER